MSKTIENAKKELLKMEQVIQKLEQELKVENGKKAPLNQKKHELILKGNQRPAVQKINQDLLEVNANVLYLKEELEVLKAEFERRKHDLALELIAFRNERLKEMSKEKQELAVELEKAKQEYLEKVEKLAGEPISKFREELNEIQNLIGTAGQGIVFSNPRALAPTEFSAFPIPRDVDPYSVFVRADDLRKIIKY
ncbi:hypothetical protein [Peribacillus simplex]|uniref:hypothetical protein n=1 Tax=Peribacillus simplex TaxID=1478 RepID=UPI0011A7A5C5|nr:hypothetical protein [Peribacillus simplex]